MYLTPSREHHLAITSIRSLGPPLQHMANPTRRHKLPLDTREAINSRFTGKLDNLYQAIINSTQYSGYNITADDQAVLNIPIVVDWPVVCDVCTKITNPKTRENRFYSEPFQVIFPVCDAIQKTADQIMRRVVKEKYTYGGEKHVRELSKEAAAWKTKFLAANLKEICFKVTGGSDVDAFIKNKVLHLELILPSRRDNILRQLETTILWESIFDEQGSEDHADNVSVTDDDSCLTPTESLAELPLTSPPPRQPSKPNTSQKTAPKNHPMMHSQSPAFILSDASELLVKTPPYTLIIQQTSSGVLIEGSHKPTIMVFRDFVYKQASPNLQVRDVIIPW